MTKNMEGKRVIVTGSGTGIGRGVALRFAEEGAAVALHYSRSSKGAKHAVEEIRKNGGKAEAFQANFTDVDDVKKFIAKAIDFLGGVDVLINNAGITMNRFIDEVSPDQYDTVYDVNVKAMFFAAQGVIPSMVEQGSGVIINTTSIHCGPTFSEHTVYAGTKNAIVGFTRSLALEMAPRGIRVNAIAPGWILVEAHLAELPDLDEKEAGLSLPIGFVGKPHDIGNLAIFLSSEESRYIVGQTIVSDGGQSIVLSGLGNVRDKMSCKWGKGYVPGVE